MKPVVTFYQYFDVHVNINKLTSYACYSSVGSLLVSPLSPVSPIYILYEHWTDYYKLLCFIDVPFTCFKLVLFMVLNVVHVTCAILAKIQFVCYTESAISIFAPGFLWSLLLLACLEASSCLSMFFYFFRSTKKKKISSLVLDTGDT